MRTPRSLTKHIRSVAIGIIAFMSIGTAIVMYASIQEEKFRERQSQIIYRRCTTAYRNEKDMIKWTSLVSKCQEDGEKKLPRIFKEYVEKFLSPSY